MADREFIRRQKELAELRKKVRLDTAYIGAGMVLAMHQKGFDDDTIIDLINVTNEIWVGLAETGINPIKHCFDVTGIQVLQDEQERELINSYFKE